VIAGYPWFTDWGRDTFIAMRGLCLANGRLDDAGAILGEWAGAVSEGMMPNRFVDQGGEPEYNSVDASLWYAIAVHDYLRARDAARSKVAPRARARLHAAIGQIVSGYAAGTRYGIRMDRDGLLACGEPGVQLTWMDAKVGDWVVTARTGKPVEIQALWINALRIVGEFAPHWDEVWRRARASFVEKFWNDAGGYLFDVVDVDHVAGANDASFRPNQVFALGGLPYPVVEGARAQRALEQIEARLWTPLGLRSLSSNDPHYAGRYEGGIRARDGSYHQGTVWPWLAGPFVEAWVRSRGSSADAKSEARNSFVRPLRSHLSEAGLGHLSEIADGDRPHRPRGCPFQAWSLGELIRIERLLADDPAPAPRTRVAAAAVR
jgi:predicted glycogen debranching enzyme